MLTTPDTPTGRDSKGKCETALLDGNHLGLAHKKVLAGTKEGTRNSATAHVFAARTPSFTANASYLTPRSIATTVALPIPGHHAR